MTRKHFEALAAAMSEARRIITDRYGDDAGGDGGAWDGWGIVQKEIADTLGQFNGNFDRERFDAACQK